MITKKEFEFSINSWIQYACEEFDGINYIPAIVCEDGFEMSVQAGIGFSSEPRCISEYYSKMEIGFPSEKEELIMEYAQTPSCPTETVYTYVPIEIINEILKKHGGITGCFAFDRNDEKSYIQFHDYE